MKDIFIDNNIAKNFANPLDPEYKKLVEWLRKYDESAKSRNAILVICNKLLAEYGRTSSGSVSPTNIWVIVDKLLRENRLNKIRNFMIVEFKRAHFKRGIVRRFRCNSDDRDYIAVVLLSYRKYAITRDFNFKHDLENFPGFTVRVGMKPQELPYDR